MNVLVAFGLALSGFAALALSQAKHRRAAFAAAPPPLGEAQFSGVGWMLLFGALLWCALSFQTGYGLVVLAATLTLAGWLVTLSLTYRPRFARALVPLGLFAAAGGLISAWLS